CSVSSNLILCRIVARSIVYPLGPTSSTLRAITSQPRSLLSSAKLNIASSRVRPSTISRVLIDQTCFGRNGGLAPVSFPLFQGVRAGPFNKVISLSGMVVLLGDENRERAWQHQPPHWTQ